MPSAIATFLFVAHGVLLGDLHAILLSQLHVLNSIDELQHVNRLNLHLFNIIYSHHNIYASSPPSALCALDFLY